MAMFAEYLKLNHIHPERVRFSQNMIDPSKYKDTYCSSILPAINQSSIGVFKILHITLRVTNI